MKETILLITFISLTYLGLGQTSPVNETFSNLGPYSGYQTETWTGDQGGTWTATDARTDQPINGKAITIRNGELTSPEASGGIGNLTLKTQRVFSGGSGNLTVKVNSTNVGTIPYSGLEQTNSIANINTTGNVVVVIETPGNGDRIVMDDLQWTAYSGGGNNPPSISNITQTPSSGITSSTTVTVSADVTDSDGTINNVELHWGTTSGSLGTSIKMSNTTGDTYETDSDIPIQSEGISVYYKVVAQDNEGAQTPSYVKKYTVEDVLNLPFEEDFSLGLYVVTLGAEGSDTSVKTKKDYFFKTDGTDISYDYTNGTGNFFAGQDINDGGWTNSDSPSQLTWFDIEVSSVSDLVFSCDFASEGGGIDASDNLLFEYRVDDGVWNSVIAFENKGGYNTSFWVDTDFDGTGDGEKLTNSFETFSKELTVSCSKIDLRFTVNLNSEGEDFAIDNVSLSEKMVTPEPSNHVTDFSATASNYEQIDLSWTDATGSTLPDGYIIKANKTSTFSEPTDGTDPAEDTDLSDGSALIKVSNGIESCSFTGLSEATRYYFKTWPYTNSGSDIDFKTDGSVPVSDAITDAPPAVPKLIISEVTDPADEADAKYVELYNADNTAVNLNGWSIRRYANGSSSSSDVNLSNHTLSTNQTLTIAYNSTFTTEYGFSADIENGYISGNGDDVYELYDGSNVVDIYGKVGVDGTGEVWEYTDSKAIRKNSVTSPSETWTESEWNIISNCNTMSMTPGMHPVTTWNGEASAGNDWHEISNWDNGIPADGVSVLIPAALSNYPTLQTSATVEDIVMAEGASLIGQEYLTIGGNARVRQYIHGYNTEGCVDGWHLLSSPVDTFAIDGSDFDPGSNDDFYGWEELTNTWKNHKAGNPGDITPGRGYLVAYENSVTKEFSGAFNTGDITVNDLTYTPDEGNGWNLVGNPFSSAIQWDNGDWSHDNFQATAKIRDESGGNYKDISSGGTTIIPVNQGFFVQTTADGVGLTIPSSAQVHNGQGFYKNAKESEGFLKLKVSASANSFFDIQTVRLHEASDGSYDRYDSEKFYGNENAPQLYSIDENLGNLSTHSVHPSSIDGTRIFPLGFESVNGEYILSLETNTLGNEYGIAAEDLQTGNMVDFTTDTTYTFVAASGDDHHRFNLHLTKLTTGLAASEILEGVNIYSHHHTIYITTNRQLTDAKITLYNSIGQMVMQRAFASASEIIRKSTPGAYLVKVMASEGVTTKKIILR